MTIPSDWTPTTDNINSLPDPVRHYIHQLQTRTDPAGDVRRIAELKDQVEALQVLLAAAKAENEALKDQIDNLEDKLDDAFHIGLERDTRDF